MKKGINAWCFPAAFSLEEILKSAASNNYDGVELNMSEASADKDGGLKGTGLSDNDILTLGMGEDGWFKIKNMADKYKINLPSVSTSLHWSYPLTDNDPAKREKGQQIVREMIDAAAFFGADTVLVVPGAVTEEVSYVTAYKRAVDAFKDLSGYAEQKKVKIGIENVWNKFLLSPMEMAAFIDEIGSEYVRAYFDAGNVLQFSYPQHWAEALGTRIAKVHIKDFDPEIGNITGFKALLHGQMHWEKLMAALHSVGYDGYLTAELSPYKHNPAQLIADTSIAMDYILSL